MNPENLGLSLAFLAGLASFLSPCVFSLVPAYVGYLGGRSIASASDVKYNRWVTFSHGLAFVLGFSVVFISLGIASSALGWVFDMKGLLAKVGGIVVIIFGLHMTGILRIKFLEYDLRPQTVPDRNRGYVASFLMGVFFSAGWAPCVGPILGAILTLAMNGGSIRQGVMLLSAYSAGLAIPFLVASIWIGFVTTGIRRYGKAMHYVEVGMGVVLIIVGLLLFSGRYGQLAQYATFYGIYNEVLLGKYLLFGVVLLIFLGLVPAYIASRKGRNFLDWWLFGAALFPVAMIAVFFIKPSDNPPVPPSKGDDEGLAVGPQ
jgi:cytochrome c-type biogenesis protein